MNYVCSICGFVYDEAAQKLPFADLPNSWICPLCRAPKSAFAPQAPAEEKKAVARTPVTIKSELNALTVSELSPLFSNLARGCEKQYKDREAQQFREIAAYFDAAAPAVPAGDEKQLLELVRQDLQDNYPALEAIASEKHDRGTLRAYTWGLKVTRMQEALLERYQQEGETFLENTNVWVCSVCGFIYVGDEAPELCPVCKVPAWKFDRIEGGMSK